MLYDDQKKTEHSSPSSKPTMSTAKTSNYATPIQQPAWTQAMGGHPPASLQTKQSVIQPANVIEQRALVLSSIEFLCAGAGLYRAGAVINEARLSRQLTHWREILLGALQVIHGSLNNDVVLEKDLKLAYQDAVQALINAAASQLKRDRHQLYAAYRDQIQEWANLYPTATPVGKEEAFKKSGSTVLHVGSITVIVKPDKIGQTKGHPADTFFQFEQWNIHYEAPYNRVTDFTPPKLTMSIQTVYRPDVDPESKSGYGKGTTERDIKEGRTSLKYHEGGHGQDFIQYLHDNQPPTFKGTKGMTPKAFEQTIKQFNEDMNKYMEAMKAYSVAKTHCVGITIDEYNHVHGVECK